MNWHDERASDTKAVASAKVRASLPCYVCGCKDGERHDSDMHRDYARESRVY